MCGWRITRAGLDGMAVPSGLPHTFVFLTDIVPYRLSVGKTHLSERTVLPLQGPPMQLIRIRGP